MGHLSGYPIIRNTEEVTAAEQEKLERNEYPGLLPHEDPARKEVVIVVVMDAERTEGRVANILRERSMTTMWGGTAGRGRPGSPTMRLGRRWWTAVGLGEIGCVGTLVFLLVNMPMIAVTFLLLASFA